MSENEAGEVATSPLKKLKTVKWIVETPADLQSLLFNDNAQQAAYVEKQEKIKTSKQQLIESVLPKITQEQWDALNGKGKWDSIVALRGPDFINSGVLKWFTSSVIRHRMSGIMRVGGLVNSTLPFVTLPSGLYAPRTGNFDAGHFLGHISEAAMWLSVPIAWVEGKVFSTVLLSSSNEHYYQAELKLYPHMQEPFKSILGLAITSHGYTLPEKEPAPCPE
jgi:hypothetical protein